MPLTSLPDVNGAASFVVENIHTDLVAEINIASAIPTCEHAPVTFASCTPENAVTTPHEAIVFDYGSNILPLPSPCSRQLRLHYKLRARILSRDAEVRASCRSLREVIDGTLPGCREVTTSGSSDGSMAKCLSSLYRCASISPSEIGRWPREIGLPRIRNSSGIWQM